MSLTDVRGGRSGNDIWLSLLVRYVMYERLIQEAMKYESHRERLTRGFGIGYHVPAVRRRDLFYAKLERDREANQGTV